MLKKYFKQQLTEQVTLYTDQEYVSKDIDIANCFRKYFSTQAQTATDKNFGSNKLMHKSTTSHHSSRTQCSYIPRVRNQNNHSGTIISESQRSYGPDGVSKKVLKHVTSELLTPRAHLFNLSF